MKTENLIRALAVDGRIPPRPLMQTLGLWLLPGLAISIAAYAARLGLRPDLLNALRADPRVFFKIASMLLLAGLAAPLTLQLIRPGAAVRGRLLMLMIVPALMLIAVLLELHAFPEADWGPRLIGHNAVFCLITIPVLALAPLGVVLAALRRGAPLRPGLTGAAAGLLAGAIGATLYATHCPDDSPLFVAVWYSLGIAFAAMIGGLLGRRILRW
jgi:hypothetical protein